MTSENKIIGGIILLSLIMLIVGGWFFIRNDRKNTERLSKPLMGEKIVDQGRSHVPIGTKVDYNSNPPTSGPHYANPQPAGVYTEPVPDGNLVHSMEHGAVILWYKSNLSKNKVDELKKIFIGVSVSKKIMLPRENLKVPVALTSWGRLLKLQTIDGARIKEFMETNYNRAPEEAPL